MKSKKQQTPTPEELKELEMIKEEILAQREVFASYDFYMPDFETVIENIQDIITANRITSFYDSSIPGVGIEIIPFSNGNNKTHEIARHFAQIRIQGMLTRLEISPEPLIALKNEGELYKQYIQSQTAKDKDFSMGYEDIFRGFSEPIKSVYKRALYKRFRETDFDPLSNYGYREPDTFIPIRFIKAAVLTDKQAAFAMNIVKDTVHGAIYAYFETLLSKIEEEISAGKTIAQIQAELLPEKSDREKGIQHIDDSAQAPEAENTANKAPGKSSMETGDFYALYHWILIEIGKAEPFEKNRQNDYIAIKIKELALKNYPNGAGIDGQSFYRGIRRIVDNSAHDVAQRLRIGYKQKMIELSGNDPDFIDCLNDYPG